MKSDLIAGNLNVVEITSLQSNFNFKGMMSVCWVAKYIQDNFNISLKNPSDNWTILLSMWKILSTVRVLLPSEINTASNWKKLRSTSSAGLSVISLEQRKQHQQQQNHVSFSSQHIFPLSRVSVELHKNCICDFGFWFKMAFPGQPKSIESLSHFCPPSNPCRLSSQLLGTYTANNTPL